MPLTDWELWACAAKMITDHGADAGTQAAMRADRLLERGDHNGYRTWLAVLHKVEDLQHPLATLQ